MNHLCEFNQLDVKTKQPTRLCWCGKRKSFDLSRELRGYGD